ncbi:ATP-dependent nuclease [Streptococcus dysgalactiae subsp. equisimilis]|uniref:ATP-dependent nuclease n=1 Tax=Streptococcus dysgalactiae TaxID=1334 RepID=UPI003FD881F4
MSDTKELLNTLTHMFRSKRIFYPFIEHIRFPKYKALEQNSRINFTYPVTLLVGQNGSNKTSILQALYGAPVGKSIGDYWFSTDVDKITDGEGIDRQCFIYGYYLDSAQKTVEVLKTRISKEGKPDYWEPARPQKSYSMETHDDYTKHGSSSKTRWDVLNKDVVYCDCKEYVSAFDLFFYHYDFESTKTQRTKQDFIRKRSKPLAKVLHNGDTNYTYYNKEMVDENVSIDSGVCAKVSEIMGEAYSEIKILTHNFYTKSSGNKPSKTIWIKKNGKEYSEAFAGTGEARIILLVNDILNAPEKSLILIDEPEISLHPSAVYRFKNFILEQAKDKKHQIVITTHSTQLVKGFPKEAIKLVSKIGNKIQITENVDFQDAFYELGEDYSNKQRIYVEDKLAKSILEYIIEKSGSRLLKENIIVSNVPGGAEKIIRDNIVNSSSGGQVNCHYWLDGDKKINFRDFEDIIKPHYISEEKVLSKQIPEADYSNLKTIIDKMVGQEVNIKVSGNSGTTNAEELVNEQKKFIDYWAIYVDFLPCLTPERLLAELDNKKNNNNYDFSKDENGKEYFENKVRQALDIDSVDSDDVFYEQRRAFKLIGIESKFYIQIYDMLNQIVKIE